jgi:hypothetical protein
MKVRVFQVIRVPDYGIRITQNKFEFYKLPPKIPEQNLGFEFKYSGSGYGFFFPALGTRVGEVS